MTSFGYDKNQLQRRPAPAATATGGIWGTIAWFDGATISNGTVWPPPTWEEAFISDEATTGGWLFPGSDFTLHFEDLGEGAVWMTEARAQVFPDSGFTDPGDFAGIGNLISLGATYLNLDIHNFQEFDLLSTYAFNNTLNLCAPRVITNPGFEHFFAMEVICATVVSGIDMFINEIQLTAYRPVGGGFTFSTS
jgi:hypothetical protein